MWTEGGPPRPRRSHGSGRRGPRAPRVLHFLYLFLAGTRLALVGAPGYVHPDEFFQSGAVAARALFCPAAAPETPETPETPEMPEMPETTTSVRLRPHPHADACPPGAWEFAPEHAVRSVAHAAATAFVPLGLLRVLAARLCSPGSSSSCTHTLLGARALLVAPRLVQATLSFVLDWSVVRTLRTHSSPAAGRGTAVALLLLASAWPMLVLHTRTLSNAAEGVLVALALTLALELVAHATGCGSGGRRRRTPTALLWALLGAVCALGTFVRFTFPLFAAAAVAAAVLVRGPGARRGARALAASLGAGAAGAAVAAVLCLALDAHFYGRWILAPLRGLIYNSRAANLAAHGLHPRYVHAAVNLPLLFAPLLPPALLAVLRAPPALPPRPGTARLLPGRFVRVTLAASVAVPLLALSLAPHQEPRFLLPLLFPLVLLAAAGVTDGDCARDTDGSPPLRRRAPRRVWLVVLAALFNAALAVFFGFLHQSGAVRAVLDAEALQAAARSGGVPPPHFVFFHTYLPPVYLLLGMEHADYDVVDLQGAAPDVLAAHLAGLDAAGDGVPVCDTIVYAPLPVLPTLPQGLLALNATFWGHFSAEDPPGPPLSTLAEQLSLGRLFFSVPSCARLRGDSTTPR